MKKFTISLILTALLLSSLHGGLSAIPAVYSAGVGQPTISVKTPLNNSIVYDPLGANCNDTSIGFNLNATVSDPMGLSLLAWSAFNGVGPSWSPMYGVKSVNSAGGRLCGGGPQWHNGAVFSSWIRIADNGSIIKGSPSQFNVTLVDGGLYHAMVFANNTAGGVTVSKVFFTLRISTAPLTAPPGQPQPYPTAITAFLILGASLATVLLYRSRKQMKNAPEFNPSTSPPAHQIPSP